MKTKKSAPAKSAIPPGKKASGRTRPPVTITLSEDAIRMAARVTKAEGQTLSRLVERWIRDTFREGGLTLPEE